MSSSLDYLELCRLCLGKEHAQVPIFEDDGDVHQIFLKIHACLPVKVSRDDKLPKKICDNCSYKVELFYEFWNATASAEKQLVQWLSEVDGLEDKQQGYVTEVLDSNVMKQEGSSDSRLDVVMQVSGHQNMDMSMIENVSIITMPAGSEQQFTTVPMGTGGGTVQTVQVSGPSTQTAHDQTGVAHLQEVEVDQEDEDNMDDGCDNDDGLPVKEETDEGDGSLEQSYVSLPCDEAGPSGLQRQKISEMSEITIQQTADGDHKTGDETFGGLSGMLRQILSPSSESDELNFLHHHHQQYSTSVLTSSLQMQPPALSHHQLVTMQEQQQQQLLYQDHVQLLTETHSCPHCGTKLTWHVRTSEINAEALLMRFTCHSCSRTFFAQSHMGLQIEQLPAAPQPPPAAAAQATYQAPALPPPPPQQQKQDNNNFSCERCQATFRYRTLLEKHRRMHEAAAGQDKPYSCPRCLMRFETRNLYNHHAKTHKPERASATSGAMGTGSASGGAGAVAKDEAALLYGGGGKANSGGNAYSCETCAKEFPTPESLASHKSVHRSRPLICDVCGKGFTHRKYYVVHQRIHTGERPYLCAMCGKSFTQASTLTVHRRYHTGERPYTCTLCGKGFVTRTIMLNHMKKH